MNRRRTTLRSLTTTRIYVKGKKFWYFAPEDMVNPKSGKVLRWHPLCRIEEGEARARELAKEVVNHNTGKAGGDMALQLKQYLIHLLKKREPSKPKEVARLKMWELGNKELGRSIGQISEAFEEFNVDQVQPVDVANFVDQWEGRRMGQAYLARLSDFFRWCARRGLRSDNPCALVSVEKPRSRDRYITDDEYHKIREGLLGTEEHKTQTGEMVQCYMDLCYLLYQRTTEIRLLRWSDVTDDGIYFKPTKTEQSSGARVFIPMTDEVRAVLFRARSIGKVKGMYVIHTREGKPYTAHGLGSAWKRACARAGIEDATLKDLRAKALTDAKKLGYTMEQIMVGAAHMDTDTTEGYIKRRETPISEICLKLPLGAQK